MNRVKNKLSNDMLEISFDHHWEKFKKGIDGYSCRIKICGKYQDQNFIDNYNRDFIKDYHEYQERKAVEDPLGYYLEPKRQMKTIINHLKGGNLVMYQDYYNGNDFGVWIELRYINTTNKTDTPNQKSRWNNHHKKHKHKGRNNGKSNHPS